jgi:hypothetical protein
MIGKISRLWRDKRAERALGHQIHATFHRHKAIFIHIPKAAGSSVSLSLFGHQVGHWTMMDWYRRDPDAAEQYFKFAFVRDPLTRLHSAYHYLRGGGMNSRDREIGAILSPRFDTFVSQLKDDPRLAKWFHFRPQNEFICSPDMRVLVNFVGRFESIEQDFRFVAERIGIGANLTVRNPGPKRELEVAPATRELIREHYEADYQTFGY